MADMRVTPVTGLLGSSSTSPVDFKGMLDGTAFTGDWLLRQALAGNCVTINLGTGTAPATSAGAYVNTTPDVDIRVPAGTLAIPYNIQLGVEAYGTTLLFEAVAAYGSGGTYTPTSLDTATVKNNRTDIATSTKGITAGGTGTGAVYMDDAIEFMRHQIDKIVTIATADDDSTNHYSVYNWSARDTGNWPIMYNPGTFTRLNIWASGQATTFFAIVSMVVISDPLSHAA